MAVVNGQIGSGVLVSVGGGQALRADAAAAWLAVVAEVRARFGIVLRLTDSYRPYAVQVRIFNERYDPASSGGGPFGDVRWWGGVRYVRRRGASAAVPGTSNHGLGVAVDVTGLGGFDTSDGSAYARLAAVAPAHGWSNKAGRKINEPWHWEYTPADDGHPTPAPAAQPTLPTPAGSVPTTPLEVIDMRQAIIDIFEHYTGFAPSEGQVREFTAFWMLQGSAVTAQQIRDSAAGQVARIFLDELGRYPESQATVAAYLRQFGTDFAGMKAAIHAQTEAVQYRARLA